MASRVLWKGAISFGLVHIPVALHSATTESDLDFDWLDKRSMDPVGYKRINKRTGKDIEKENIVKGIAYEPDHYVVLTPEEISAAYPKTTQTIEIEAFVDASDVSPLYMERPYYVEPINRGEKVYALLRETLHAKGRVAIAKVVIQAKQHLAVLMPDGPAMVLNLMRWGGEVRGHDDLNLPAQGAKGVALADRELKMASQLVDDMTVAWNVDSYRDSFRDAILKLVDSKVKAGKTETVIDPQEQAPAETGGNVVDLMELLQRSLKGKPESAAKRSTKAVGKAPEKKSKLSGAKRASG